MDEADVLMAAESAGVPRHAVACRATALPLTLHCTADIDAVEAAGLAEAEVDASTTAATPTAPLLSPRCRPSVDASGRGVAPRCEGQVDHRCVVHTIDATAAAATDVEGTAWVGDSFIEAAAASAHDCGVAVAAATAAPTAPAAARLGDVPSPASCAVCPAASAKSAVASAPTRDSCSLGEALPDAETTSVTMWVPTLFTTAAGRPICIRERRPLTADSPYWKLLSFRPGRSAAVAADDGAFTFEGGAPQDADEDAMPGESIDATRGSLCNRVAPLTSTHVGCGWMRPFGSGGWWARRRATSCPNRFVSAAWTAQEEAGLDRAAGALALPSFSGFCTAGGRPLFRSPHAGSSDGDVGAPEDV